MNNKFDLISEFSEKIIKMDENVFILVVDCWECYLFNKVKTRLTEEQRKRIINVGISEQNAVGFAAGLSMAGKTVYIIGVGAFLANRASEQIKLDIAYNNANVKIIAIHSGFTGARLGGYSHWALNETATLYSYHNMTILSPSNNEEEIRQVLEYSYKKNGPVYIKMENPARENSLTYNVKALNSVPATSQAYTPPRSTKRKIVFLASGNMVEDAINLAQEYTVNGINSSVYSVYSIKPFDFRLLEEITKSKVLIVTMEEHSQYGGIASITAQEIAKNRKRKSELISCYAADKPFNLIFNDYNNILDYVMDFEELKQQIEYKVNNSNKLVLFKYLFNIDYKRDKKNRLNKIYRFIGIPVLKIRHEIGLNNIKKHVYLLNIRIFKYEIKRK